jgi:hypothetical protein
MNKRITALAAGLAVVAFGIGAAAAPAAFASDPVPVHQPNGNPVDGGPAHLGALGDPDDGGQVHAAR